MKKYALLISLVISGVTASAQSHAGLIPGVSPNIFGSNSFGVGVSASTLTLSPGQGGTIGITVSEKCKTWVTFWASGFPSGVDYTFLPDVSQTGSILVVYAPPTTAIGNYTITVTGTAGWTVESTSFTLAIAAPNFSVSAPAASLTLPRGTGTTVPITVEPGPGFTGVVTFGLTGIPAGVSYVFLPASSTTGSTLVIYASKQAAAGTYNVALTGTSGGVTVSVSGQLILQ